VREREDCAAACIYRGWASFAGRSLFLANRVPPPLENATVETMVSQLRESCDTAA